MTNPLLRCRSRRSLRLPPLVARRHLSFCRETRLVPVLMCRQVRQLVRAEMFSIETAGIKLHAGREHRNEFVYIVLLSWIQNRTQGCLVFFGGGEGRDMAQQHKLHAEPFLFTNGWKFQIQSGWAGPLSLLRSTRHDVDTVVGFPDRSEAFFLVDAVLRSPPGRAGSATKPRHIVPV